MKSFLIYITLIFTIYSNINSQILDGYGLKAGMTSSNQLFDYSDDFILDDEDYDYRYGLNFGVFAEILQSRYFSVVFDISYNQKGSKDILNFAYVDTNEQGYSSYKKTVDRRFDYITTSINIKSRYDFNNFSAYILMGLGTYALQNFLKPIE